MWAIEVHVMDEWVEEYVQMSEWASEKMNEVMIGGLNEKGHLGQNSSIGMFLGSGSVTKPGSV